MPFMVMNSARPTLFIPVGERKWRTFIHLMVIDIRSRCKRSDPFKQHWAPWIVAMNFPGLVTNTAWMIPLSAQSYGTNKPECDARMKLRQWPK